MDELISPIVVAALRDSLKAVAPRLELSTLTEAERVVPGKRLRDRVDIVRDALLEDIPAGFPAAERTILDVLVIPGFAGWMIWPTTEFVTARAIESGSTADFDAGMELLAELTMVLSSEFAVRDMLNARPERALDVMRSWADHENEHVRRLASEGSRAFLPWAKRVPWLLAHPNATRGIIDSIYRDPAEYVRRSVANHLNDLSRVDAALVTEVGQAWQAEPDANTPWVLRHGLRTLIKKANPEALALLGYAGAGLRVDRPQLTSPTVPQGGTIGFSAVVTNGGDSNAAVAIDYSIGFVRANGAVSPKTFKLTSRRLAPGESVTVSKSHSFRPITTRSYYPGAHFVTVQANGTLSPRAEFVLEAGAGTTAAAEQLGEG
ncbi:DNA alkylation repair protein [Herbiconiux sp. P15]|uniref:DNA alkylation repair protein n=1 Tax=Herbiconiux liukaitaii TaxID=3342799 RepID=UPI0035B9D81F